MNINELRNILKNGQIILMNGGTGSEITARGVKTSLPLWSAEAFFTHPEVIKQIHRDYIDAGARIVVTNTFRTTEWIFKKVNLQKQAQKIALLACKLVKAAVKESGKQVWIGGSIAPLEDCYSPNLVPPVKILKEQHLINAKNLKKGGVDFALIETMISIREVVAACAAAQKVGLPFAVSFCCNFAGNLLSGESLLEAVKAIKRYQPLFISLNCMPPKTITTVIKQLRQLTDLPIGAYGQGDGKVDDDQGWISGGGEVVNGYLKEAKKWIKSGAQIIGGCCGTNPFYIRRLKNEVFYEADFAKR